MQEGGHRRGAAAPAPGLGRGGQGAGFIRLDRIRMLLEKILTFILLFNYSIYIILVLKIHNSIISALKIMNLNILLLNFLKCSIAEYASKPCSECAWCKNGPVHEEEDPDSFQEDGHACGGDEGRVSPWTHFESK